MVFTLPITLPFTSKISPLLFCDQPLGSSLISTAFSVIVFSSFILLSSFKIAGSFSTSSFTFSFLFLLLLAFEIASSTVSKNAAISSSLIVYPFVSILSFSLPKLARKLSSFSDIPFSLSKLEILL